MPGQGKGLRQPECSRHCRAPGLVVLLPYGTSLPLAAGPGTSVVMGA